MSDTSESMGSAELQERLAALRARFGELRGHL